MNHLRNYGSDLDPDFRMFTTTRVDSRFVGTRFSVSICACSPDIEPEFVYEIALCTFHTERGTMSLKNSDTDPLGIEHMDGLYGYALVLTRNHAEAEDLVQETYVRAMQAVSRLRADSNIKGWLFTILRNVWLNQLRKRRTAPQMIEIDGEEGFAEGIGTPLKDAHEIYVSEVEKKHIRAAIQKLPIQLCEIILLREYEELSYQEIANVLSCPVGTVMSRLGRARCKLRDMLSDTLKKSDLSRRGD